MTTGRPLRFLIAVTGGWLGLRAFLLWPTPDVILSGQPFIAEAEAATVAGAEVTTDVAWPVARTFAPAPSASRANAPGLIMPQRLPVPPTSQPLAAPALRARTVAVVSTAAPTVQDPTSQGALPPPLRVTEAPQSRWSASLWAIGRPSGTGGGLGASQLGGSQAGARAAYAIDPARRLAVVGRVATPLEGRGREAAIGLEWRPTRLPVRLFAEHRFALENGVRGGPSAGVIGGLDEPLPHGFRLEAYGQAGVIDRDRLQGFADGAMRATRPVTSGGTRLDLGVGAWGGAQRGAQRLDVGPTLGAVAPIGDWAIRVTLDYRARVAGGARPGSGPALSIGADF